MMRPTRTTTTLNENFTCPNCDTNGVLIHTEPTVQFHTPRTYECEDCEHEWELEDGETVTITQGFIKTEKTPIDYDRELGVVPDN